MCCVKNIENLDQVKKAICYRYNAKVVEQEVFMDVDELQTLVGESNDRTLYYGILTTGRATTVSLNLFSDGNAVVMDIEANRQIIELFEDIEAINGTNIFFRGYSLTLSSRK